MVCNNVGGILRNYAIARKKGYACLNATGVVVEHEPDTVRGPDVIFFEDAKAFSDVDEKYGDTPPILAVEVLSPNDSMGKVNRRVKEQFLHGTKLVWVVDPEAMNVTVYQLGKDYSVFESIDEITGQDILVDFRCSVAEFFRLPGQ